MLFASSFLVAMAGFHTLPLQKRELMSLAARKNMTRSVRLGYDGFGAVVSRAPHEAARPSRRAATLRTSEPALPSLRRRRLSSTTTRTPSTLARSRSAARSCR